MAQFLSAEISDQPVEAMITNLCEQLQGAHDHTVGFVYATSPLAVEFPRIVAELRRRTGLTQWVGTVGLGVCGTGAEYFDRPAMVALTCRTGPDSISVLPSVTDAADAAAARTKLMAAIGIVHGDPRNGAITGIVEGIARESDAYLVGGLTSGEGTFPQAAGAGIVDGGVSGVLLGGRDLAVAVGLTQGCSPIGPQRRVDDGQDNILVTLDGRRAYEVLLEDIGAPPDADPRQWLANIHVALPVPGSDRADYLVRNLTGIGPEQGLVAIGDRVQPGDRVMFVRRDPLSAARDLDRMLADLKGRMKSPPKAGLYYSCLARGPNLFREEAHETKAIAKAFGDMPVAGFFGNGEIAHDRLYGYTGVLVLMS